MDLCNHRIVAGPASNVPTGWLFELDGERVNVDTEAAFVTNENEGAVGAALAGVGIVSTVLWACAREIDEGLLVLLLTDWTTTAVPAHAYFPLGQATRAAARALTEFLVADLARDPCGVQVT